MDYGTGGVGYEIEQRGFRPLAVEFRKGGEHAASEFHSRKDLARGRCNILDRRLLRTLRAGLPRFQVGGAGDDDRIDLQARAPGRRGDLLKRRSHVGLIGNDHLEDDLRRGGFGRLPDRVEVGESRAVTYVGITDEEAWAQRTQGVHGGRRCFDSFIGQCDTEFGYAQWKALAQFDRYDPARLCVAFAAAASRERQAYGLLVPAPFGKRISPGQSERPYVGFVRGVGPVALVLHLKRVALHPARRP